MLWIASVTAISSAGVLFLLWCLLNFIREGSRYGSQQVKMRSTDRTETRNASVVPIREPGLARGDRHRAKIALVTLMAIACAAPAGHAQGVSAEGSEKKEIDELRQMVRELRERVAALEALSLIHI